MSSLHLIYLHGFDSTGQSQKGQLTKEYCQTHHPQVTVHCPNLNMKPEQVVKTMVAKIETLLETAPVVLIGSSFGGYFATLLSNVTGVPAFLLNPSTQPHVTLTRFYPLADEEKLDDTVFYTTVGEWGVTYGDIRWVEQHAFSTELGIGVNYPEKIALLLTTGDEVIDYTIAKEFYGSQANGTGINQIHIETGGDHRISDFDQHLPMLMKWVLQSVQ